MTRPAIRHSLFFLLLSAPAAAQIPQFGSDWLAIERVGRSGRSTVHTDAVEAALVRGTFRTPKAGDTLTRGDGQKLPWREVQRNKNRVDAGRGYAFTSVESPRAQVVRLVAKRHGMVYVNGEPRTGNPYGMGWYELPVALRKGRNEFLFQCRRGPIEARLEAIEKPVYFSGKDHTLPDLIVNEGTRTFAGIIVVNARNEPLTDARITIRGEHIRKDHASQLGAQNVSLPTIPPCGVYKCCIPLRGAAPKAAGSTKVTFELLRLGSKGVVPAGGGLQDRLELTLRIRRKSERHNRVYRSPVDHSAQYYSVNPATETDNPSRLPALFLSLHGAGVEARGQAGAYSDKSWGHLVAATNRRPFGFDWEDWGRLDAIDVLNDARRRYAVDPTRTYLTGHSMGGHGTWQVSAHFPDQFAAIGPSAGWCSFSSYAGSRSRRGRGRSEPSAMDKFLQRTASASNTLLLKHNYEQHGVFIIHGDADRNVPIREARGMMKELGTFHRDFRIHEQPGAGHWWDGDPEPGAACVDFQPMFDFFARRRLPRSSEVRKVDFTTVNPAISSRCHWVRVVRQRRRLEPSRIQIRRDPKRGGYRGTTANIARFFLTTTAGESGKQRTFTIDGQDLQAVTVQGQGFRFDSVDGQWRVTAAPAPQQAPRGGPFKHAFASNFILVYGTGGDAETRAQSMAKARYDAETFWYRGNGSVQVMADTSYKAGYQRNRSVILYGNAETNRAWKDLLGDSPVQVTGQAVEIGGKKIVGEDLACLLLRPHPAYPSAFVGAVAGTGTAGLRLTERLPYFVSGVHYPDVFVTDSSMLDRGSEGVRVAGLFGQDWAVETGAFTWR